MWPQQSNAARSLHTSESDFCFALFFLLRAIAASIAYLAGALFMS
jgi:hypothetical protein